MSTSIRMSVLFSAGRVNDSCLTLQKPEIIFMPPDVEKGLPLKVLSILSSAK